MFLKNPINSRRLKHYKPIISQIHFKKKSLIKSTTLTPQLFRYRKKFSRRVGGRRLFKTMLHQRQFFRRLYGEIRNKTLEKFIKRSVKKRHSYIWVLRNRPALFVRKIIHCNIFGLAIYYRDEVSPRRLKQFIIHGHLNTNNKYVKGPWYQRSISPELRLDYSIQKVLDCFYYFYPTLNVWHNFYAFRFSFFENRHFYYKLQYCLDSFRASFSSPYQHLEVFEPKKIIFESRIITTHSPSKHWFRFYNSLFKSNWCHIDYFFSNFQFTQFNRSFKNVICSNSLSNYKHYSFRQKNNFIRIKRNINIILFFFKSIVSYWKYYKKIIRNFSSLKFRTNDFFKFSCFSIQWFNSDTRHNLNVNFNKFVQKITFNSKFSSSVFNENKVNNTNVYSYTIKQNRNKISIGAIIIKSYKIKAQALYSRKRRFKSQLIFRHYLYIYFWRSIKVKKTYIFWKYVFGNRFFANRIYIYYDYSPKLGEARYNNKYKFAKNRIYFGKNNWNFQINKICIQQKYININKYKKKVSSNINTFDSKSQIHQIYVFFTISKVETVNIENIKNFNFFFYSVIHHYQNWTTRVSKIQTNLNYFNCLYKYTINFMYQFSNKATKTYFKKIKFSWFIRNRIKKLTKNYNNFWYQSKKIYNINFKQTVQLFKIEGKRSKKFFFCNYKKTSKSLTFIQLTKSLWWIQHIVENSIKVKNNKYRFFACPWIFSTGYLLKIKERLDYFFVKTPTIKFFKRSKMDFFFFRKYATQLSFNWKNNKKSVKYKNYINKNIQKKEIGWIENYRWSRQQKYKKFIKGTQVFYTWINDHSWLLQIILEKRSNLKRLGESNQKPWVKWPYFIKQVDIPVWIRNSFNKIRFNIRTKKYYFNYGIRYSANWGWLYKKWYYNQTIAVLGKNEKWCQIIFRYRFKALQRTFFEIITDQTRIVSLTQINSFFLFQSNFKVNWIYYELYNPTQKISIYQTQFWLNSTELTLLFFLVCSAYPIRCAKILLY